jgi:hypothetical protein
MDGASVWRVRVTCFGFGMTERPGLLDPGQDPLVLDLEFGIALGLFADLLPEDVVLPGVGRDIGQDGHLVDVGIVFWIYSLEFRMECFIAGAGQAGIAFGDLDEGISFMEVGVVIISGQLAGCGVGDLICLR